MKNVGTTLIKRNVKMFFKDKGTFFTALITPMILLVLYATFLNNVYRNSFLQVFEAIVPSANVDDNLLDGLVGGLLLSSLLSVSTVTVSFCANLCMVQDKVTGARNDFDVSPVKPRSIALGYYLSTAINGLIIGFAATVLGLIYLAITGWYLSVLDVFALFADVMILVAFGTALSSLICYPLTSQGQLSAVGTIVSAGYGFVCGAYMPISSFSSGIRNVMSFFPGTYGTALLRNHALGGAFEEVVNQGFPEIVAEELRNMSDANFYFFENKVEIWALYLVLLGATALLIGGYLLLYALKARRRKTQKATEE
ncbi:MAG: ABC transporter permease [Clostridia bacterium]|nr:ABC transporter permease [Clostridia bacterium]